MDFQGKGSIFNIQRYSTRDGPGIRTTVFLKGCPLRCFWCQNPESQSIRPKLMHNYNMCQGCGRCVVACPSEACKLDERHHAEVDRNVCQVCGTCVDLCPADCRVLAGRLVSVDEVMEQVLRDRAAYTNSGGGITISGGEPCFQAEFTIALLKAAQEEMLDTAIETCGFAPWETLSAVLDHVDYIMYDLKCMDSARHKQGTGVENELILDNARRIVRLGKPVLFRTPLIPGFNDDEENVRATARFVKYELGLDGECLELLKYNKMGEAKYERLGFEGELPDMNPQSPEELERLEEIAMTC